MPQIGRQNPQNGRKNPQTDAHLKKWSNLELQDHTERAQLPNQLASPRVSTNRANSIITRMASQLRAVHAKQQPARIATTLFHRIGQVISNSAQTAHICSLGQKQCDKPHRAKICVQMKVQAFSFRLDSRPTRFQYKDRWLTVTFSQL